MEAKEISLEAKEMSFEIVHIPIDNQIRRPAQPPTPYIAIPTNGEALPEIASVGPIQNDFTEFSAPPPPVYRDIVKKFTFTPYEIPPEPIGGMAAIKRAIQYPEQALRYRIEGRVIIGILVDETGEVIKTCVLKPSDISVGFEQAVMRAVLETKWEPARQQERAVKVWLALPVMFQILK
jgi:protein TonB